MKPPLKGGAPDDYQTPPIALRPLLPFLEKSWKIWECACGEGQLVEELERHGFEVVATDIRMGTDFLSKTPGEDFDCIITNPPYSLKQEFLERCYVLGKPFALLLPLTTFETRKRQALFKKHGVQVVFFDKRIAFTTPAGKSGDDSKSRVSTAWFTWGLGLDTLTFVRLDGKESTQARLKEEW